MRSRLLKDWRNETVGSLFFSYILGIGLVENFWQTNDKKKERGDLSILECVARNSASRT